jgi:glutaminase
MGLAVFSPRLDPHGHSVRGTALLQAWSAEWGLGLFAA